MSEYTTLDELKNYLRENFGKGCYVCGEKRAEQKVFCQSCADQFGVERMEFDPLNPLDCWTWTALKREWEIPWREELSLRCAECDGLCPLNDYLCKDCRNEQLAI